jgi:hypothetical protein
MIVTNNKNQSGGRFGDDLIKRQNQSGWSLRIRLRKEKPKGAAWLQEEQEYHCTPERTFVVGFEEEEEMRAGRRD